MPFTTINRPNTSAPAPTTKTAGCGCGCTSCDTCDSLQCLCRPRFFAGQLVTDADFRRLDQYLVGKDRLHNKFLHGSGVVCGLEVVCNPCDDTVTVRPGYALGPCGEDIVVCADTSVDVGAMIRAERRAHARAACPLGSNPYTSTPNDCDALEQRWILGICYDEQPGRAVTSLTTTACSSSCDCGCGGGGAASGGCGCGGGSHPKSPPTVAATASGCGCHGGSAKPVPVGCEPTVICEGFRFTLTKERPVRLEPVRGAITNKAVREPAGLGAAFGASPSATHGALAEHVRQCLAMLAANITSVPADASAAEIVTYCCQLKADLRAVIDSGNIHDCTLGQRLNDIACPSTGDQDAPAKAKRAVHEMLGLAIDLYRECVCSALLPPCPNDCVDDCIPIATLTVRSSDLRVLEVCNWSSRKFAVTMPMLGYWLSWLPVSTPLRRLVSNLCCAPQQRAEFTLNNKLQVAKEEVASERVAKPASASAEFVEPLRMAMRYAQHPSPLAGFEATLLQGLGVTGEKGTELATPGELADPFTAAAMSRLFGPSGLDLGSVLRDATGATGATGAAGSAEAAPPAADHASRLADLEKTVESLQRTVRSQARTISSLRKGQQK
jgi:hypothetical protein